MRMQWGLVLATFLIIAGMLFCGCDSPTRSNPENENMVFVRGGSFWMGDEWDRFYSNGEPLHQVSLNSFYIGKYEVTQAEWMALCDTNTAWFRGDSLPMEQIDWYDVFVFCNLKSLVEGLQPCYSMVDGEMYTDFSYIHTDGIQMNEEKRHFRVHCDFRANGYRLPTEAEWEYAAKGGRRSHGHLYAGSNEIDAVAWFSDNSDGETHPVGQKEPNELGLYDMSGNVIERVWDVYAEYSSHSQINPTGPSESGVRIMRGGSFSGSARYCESAYRYHHPSWRDFTTGFRLCRNAE